LASSALGPRSKLKIKFSKILAEAFRAFRTPVLVVLFPDERALADQEFFCIDNLIEAVGAKGAIQPVVPHFQQSPLAADSAAAETRIFGPFY